MSEIICRSITIRGKVQGVFFRQHTKAKADTLNINGFVRNESDGTVFILAEGKYEDIEKLIVWCHQGSPLAVVSKVEMAEAAIQNFKDFSIRR
jgi:acylphosphatase